LSAIAAYCFFEKKPVIDVYFVNDGQLAIFWFYFELTLYIVWRRNGHQQPFLDDMSLVMN
jgi:hypothetical protein